MATQDKNLNEAVKVRKISKDEFKKTYFKSSEESAVFAKDLENSTDAPVIIEEEATTEKKEKKVVTARKDMTMAQWTIKEMKRNVCY